jgi:predicted nucleotidyltransferase component of viral defense system
MAELKRINDDEFNDIASRLRFDRVKLTKDYFVTLLLYLIKDVDGIYFKGGTALNKIFLNHARLSEDMDFSLIREVSDVKKEIVEVVEKSRLFGKITYDKHVDGFLRVVVEYTSFDGQKDKVFIDLNKRAKLALPSETHKLNHFYVPLIPEFSVKTVAKEELIAEKTAATIGRNKPRDHFDVYMILKKGIPINMELVKKKCHESGDEFSILKMFNKAKMLKNRWDKDMISLISEEITFQEVITYLSKHFKLKEEKEKTKKK